MNGYGKDMSALDAVRAGTLVSGARLVAEAAYRRLTTPPGTLQGGPAEEDYGIDLPGYVGMLDSRATQLALPGIVRAELLKDDRLASVDVTVARETLPAAGVRYLVRVTGTTSLDEDFTLTVAVNDVSAEFLGITYGT